MCVEGGGGGRVGLYECKLSQTAWQDIKSRCCLIFLVIASYRESLLQVTQAIASYRKSFPICNTCDFVWPGPWESET